MGLPATHSALLTAHPQGWQFFAESPALNLIGSKQCSHIPSNTVTGLIAMVFSLAAPSSSTVIAPPAFGRFQNARIGCAGFPFSSAIAVALNIAPQPFVRVLPMKYPVSQSYFFKPLNERVPVYQKPFTLIQEVIVEGTPQAQAAFRQGLGHDQRHA